MQAEPFGYEHATEPLPCDAVRPNHERKNDWTGASSLEHAVLIKTFEAHLETLKAQVNAAEARFAERAALHAAEQSARIKSLEDHIETLKAQLTAAEARAERRAADFADRSPQHVPELAALIKTLEVQLETLKVQISTAEAHAEQQAAVADRNAQHIAEKESLIKTLETQVETLKVQLTAAEVRAERQAAEFAQRLAEEDAAIAAERAKTEAERAKAKKALAFVERLGSERREEEREPAVGPWWRRLLAPRSAAIPERQERYEWELPSMASLQNDVDGSALAASLPEQASSKARAALRRGNVTP
jgi:hypothetical protein